MSAARAPLAISFFLTAFTGPNQRNLGRQQLIDSLDDVLFGLRDAYGEDKFPRQASEYLDDWAAPERRWLRKYYVQGQDEPRYDLTPEAEDVVRWVESLRGRDFVATQSRLTSIFAVLERLVRSRRRTRKNGSLSFKPKRTLSTPRCSASVMATTA